jgi:hypothetical protein
MATTATFQKATIVAGRRVARRSSRLDVACKATAVKLDFDTTAFQKDLVEFAGEPEYIVKGGRDKFANLPKAFKDIKEVRGYRYCLHCVCCSAWCQSMALYDVRLAQASPQLQHAAPPLKIAGPSRANAYLNELHSRF